MGTVPDNQKAENEILPQAATRKVRHLVADGLRWEVREVPAPQFDRRGGAHLVFDGEQVMRRVRFFPPDWESLSDEALYALSQQIRR